MTLKIPKEQAVFLFGDELDFHGAKRWPEEKFQGALKKIHKISQEEELKAKTPEGQALLDEVLKTLNENGKVKVVFGKKDKAATAAKESPSKNGEKKKAKKVEVAVDRFGTNQDSRAATLNACIGKKPKTYKELVVEAGFEKDPYLRDHLRKLVGKGFIEEPETNVYCLPGGGKATATGKKKKAAATT